MNSRNSRNLIPLKLLNFWIVKIKSLFSLVNAFSNLILKNTATGKMFFCRNSLNLFLSKYLKYGSSWCKLILAKIKSFENLPAKINFLKVWQHILLHPLCFVSQLHNKHQCTLSQYCTGMGNSIKPLS